MPSQQNLAERSMAMGLRALNWLAASDLVDRLGMRGSAERFLHTASKTTMRTAARAGRTFAAAQKLSRPARQPRAKRSDLFDLTPTDEQQMLSESVRDFALQRLRPAAEQADAECATSPELLGQANELGLTMVGVPEELGGAVEQRSAVTSVLMSEALAQGDMGIGVACLAPAGVSTALGLWGDADQQATYLPSFVADDVPSAALALLEPHALFDPRRLQTTARSANGGYVVNGVKALVPRASDGELFIVAAELDGHGPALFLVESKTGGLSVEPDPGVGIRAAVRTRGDACTQAVLGARDDDRLRRRADARRPRLRQGASGRALVSRPACGGTDGRRSARLMPINLEIPRKFQQLVDQAHMVATEVFRPNSRKYDRAEHTYPKELDMLAAVIDGMNEGGALGGAGAGGVGTVGPERNGGSSAPADGNRNGSNMA